MNLRAIALACALVLGTTGAQAAGVDVSQAWSRPAIAGAPGVGYMTLANLSSMPQVLVSVESPIARNVEIHQSSMAGGIASMRPVDRLTIPAGGTVTFAPRGYHLMFMDLTGPLKMGDTLPATLVFAGGVRVKATFAVGLGTAGEEHTHN